MKGDFIIKFLEIIKDIAVELGTGWTRIPYKGVCYSNFDIYGNDVRKKYTGFKNLEKRGLIKDIIVVESVGFKEKELLKTFDLEFSERGAKWRFIYILSERS